MAFIITRYNAGWHLKKRRGVINITSTTGTKERLRFINASEFAAVLAILATADEATLTESGWIGTGTEKIDG